MTSPTSPSFVHAVALGFVVWTAGACRPPRPEEPRTRTPSTIVDLAGLETWFLSTNQLACHGHIEAEGAVSVDLDSKLSRGPDGLQLLASGTFAGQDVNVEVSRKGAIAHEYWVNKAVKFTAAPESLEEALFIGIVRMGLLHNLARLVGGEPPDHAEGGVRAWLKFDAETPITSDDHYTWRGFDVIVAGEHSAIARLGWTETLRSDRVTGITLVRRQNVNFDTGEMRVREAISCSSTHP